MGSSAGLIGELMIGGRMGLNDAHLCGKDTLRKGKVSKHANPPCEQPATRSGFGAGGR